MLIERGMSYTIGTGRFRLGAPYSELKALLERGYRIMKYHGLHGNMLQQGARIYARTVRQFYEQGGGSVGHELEREVLQWVFNELGMLESIAKDLTILSDQSSFIKAAHEFQEGGLKPITSIAYLDAETSLDNPENNERSSSSR